MSRKVTLDHRSDLDQGSLRSFAWRRALPFVVNTRAKLIHRVRTGRTYFRNGVYSHHAVTYWCGNCTTFDSSDDALTIDPPTSRLLCAFCEAKAVAHGQASADVLAGRHVHIGTLRAFRECCRDEQN